MFVDWPRTSRVVHTDRCRFTPCLASKRPALALTYGGFLTRCAALVADGGKVKRDVKRRVLELLTIAGRFDWSGIEVGCQVYCNPFTHRTDGLYDLYDLFPLDDLDL